MIYTTATATWNSSRAYNLHCSSQHHWILNPLSEARYRTDLMVPSWICFHCAITGTTGRLLRVVKNSIRIQSWEAESPQYSETHLQEFNQVPTRKFRGKFLSASSRRGKETI